MTQCEFCTAVLLPAFLGRLDAERLLLAVTDGANDAVGGHAGVDQGILGGLGTVLTQRKVVLFRAALVAIAADHDLDVEMAPEIRGILGERGLGVAAEIGQVVIEENVLNVDIGLEHLFWSRIAQRRLMVFHVEIPRRACPVPMGIRRLSLNFLQIRNPVILKRTSEFERLARLVDPSLLVLVPASMRFFDNGPRFGVVRTPLVELIPRLFKYS